MSKQREKGVIQISTLSYGGEQRLLAKGTAPRGLERYLIERLSGYAALGEPLWQPVKLLLQSGTTTERELLDLIAALCVRIEELELAQGRNGSRDKEDKAPADQVAPRDESSPEPSRPMAAKGEEA